MLVCFYEIPSSIDATINESDLRTLAITLRKIKMCCRCDKDDCQCYVLPCSLHQKGSPSLTVIGCDSVDSRERQRIKIKVVLASIVQELRRYLNSSLPQPVIRTLPSSFKTKALMAQMREAHRYRPSWGEERYDRYRIRSPKIFTDLLQVYPRRRCLTFDSAEEEEVGRAFLSWRSLMLHFKVSPSDKLVSFPVQAQPLSFRDMGQYDKVLMSTK